MTLRRVGSQGGLEEVDSICRAQGLPLLMPHELNGLKCLCVCAHLRARALAPLPHRSSGCRLMFGNAHTGAKFNSFGRALPLIRLPPVTVDASPDSLPHTFPPTLQDGPGRRAPLPPRQTPRASQVELPVTMRQPLETDGLQTACHVYCCCHKRQESNNTVPQDARGKHTGAPQTAAWGGWAAAAGASAARGGTLQHSHTLN